MALLTRTHRPECDESHTGFASPCNTTNAHANECQWCSTVATDVVRRMSLCDACAATAKVQMMLGVVPA